MSFAVISNAPYDSFLAKFRKEYRA